MPQLNEGNINSYLVPSGSLTGSLSKSGTLTGQIAIGAGGGTSDYNDLSNKPQINSVTLSGNKTTSDLNISYNDLDDKPTIPAAQVNSDWNAESGVAEILNKPTIPTKLKDLSDVNYSNPYPKDYLRWDSIGVGWTAYSRDDRVEGLSNVLTDEYEVGQVLQLTSISGQHTWRNQKLDYSNIVNTPTIPAAQVNSDWNAASGVAEILNKPTLATVATSGSYNDLTDQPTIPDLSVQDVSSTFTITKISGAWSVASFVAYKSGTLIYIRIRYSGSGTQVNGGSDAFAGTISSSYLPIVDSFGQGFASNTLFLQQINNDGNIKVRLINDNYTLGSGVIAAVSNLYFVNV